MDADGQVPRPSGRSRRRRNVVRSSPNREDYTRLLEAGWSSLSLERYAAFRFGEDIPSRTFREFRDKLGLNVRVNPFDKTPSDLQIDVIADRAQLIRLQQQRISVDVKHELQMSKLFQTTGREIDTLSRLLTEHKADLQDIGVFPKAGDVLTVHAPTAESAPRALTLGALLGSPDAIPEVQAQLARVLHLAAPSNGKVV